MTSPMHHKIYPDYADLDNKTGHCPGYHLYLCENDGGIGIQMWLEGNDPDKVKCPMVFMNVEEARDLLNDLQRAVDRAAPKNVPQLVHKRRGRVPS